MSSMRVTTATIDVRCPNDREHMLFNVVARVQHEEDEEDRENASDVAWMREWIATDHPTVCPRCGANITVEIAWPRHQSETVPVHPSVEDGK